MVHVIENNEPEYIYVDSVTLNTGSITLEEGTTKMVYATIKPINAKNQNITWLSSNTNVVTINNGQLTAIKEGNAVITAYVDENKNSVLDTFEESATMNVLITKKVVTPPTNEDPIPASGQVLPIGNTTVSGPKNLNPIDITNWVNFDTKNELPAYWGFIMGNNKKDSSTDFYQNIEGGFKFSQIRYGLQTPLLNQWLKTEVRLSVSQVNNKSQNVNTHKGKPIFHIYCYDKTGRYIAMTTFEQQDSFQASKELKFYIGNENMAYFEIRLNAFPYKGSQCYNFGVSKISIKGWPYPL